MIDYNKTIIVGRASRDAELMYLPGRADPVCKFGIVVNRSWQKNGEWQQKACFLDCSIFGKLGEAAEQNIKKGMTVLVEGYLDHQTWTKDGQRHSKHELIVEKVKWDKPKAVSQDNGSDSGGFQTEDDVPF